MTRRHGDKDDKKDLSASESIRRGGRPRVPAPPSSESIEPPRLRVSGSASSDLFPAAESAPAFTPEPRPAKPLTHQPLVAISLVLICATLGQLGTWVVNVRLLTPSMDAVAVSPPSMLLADPLLFNALQWTVDRLNRSEVPGPRLMFGVCLLLAMASTVAWYAVARTWLGRAWALWAGLLWAINPLFAFMAQRPGPLTLSLVLVPTAWWFMVRWSRSRHRRTALLAGITAGITAVATPPMLFAFAMGSPLLLASIWGRRKSLQGFLLMALGFALAPAIVSVLVQQHRIDNPARAYADQLLLTLDGSDAPRITPTAARAAEAEGSMAPTRFAALLREVARSPVQWSTWLGRRAWRTLYSTADGHFERPLFIVHLIVLLPALWGAVVCLCQPVWRWPSLAGILLLVTFWLIAAIADPLARSVAPAGGVLAIFALVAISDLYERAFDRELAATQFGASSTR